LGSRHARASSGDAEVCHPLSPIGRTVPSSKVRACSPGRESVPGRSAMSIVVRFPVVGLTRQQYDEVSRRLEEAGMWPPDGMQLHVLFGTEGDLKVSEIWESPQQLTSFGEQLLPVLNEVGVQTAGEPEIFEVHNLEQPRTTA
jgi:hypothetical protein